MKQDRRSFLKEAGTVWAMTAATRVGATRNRGGEASASRSGGESATGPMSKGLARGLTLLTISRGGIYRLGVKTDKGILDVAAATKLLKMRAPITMDDRNLSNIYADFPLAL